jgi:WD40 repeat protein
MPRFGTPQADGVPVGEPLVGHADWVQAVAVGVLPDGTSVIVSSGDDGTVRVWRLADYAPLAPPLDLSEGVRDIALHGSTIAIASGTDITVCQMVLT